MGKYKIPDSFALPPEISLRSLPSDPSAIVFASREFERRICESLAVDKALLEPRDSTVLTMSYGGRLIRQREFHLELKKTLRAVEEYMQLLYRRAGVISQSPQFCGCGNLKSVFTLKCRRCARESKLSKREQNRLLSKRRGCRR